MRKTLATKLLTKACVASLALHLCALGMFAAGSVHQLTRSPKLGASPGVVVMQASFSEPEPPVVAVEVAFTQKQVLILPHRAEALTRRFVEMPSARVPLEQLLTREVLDRLLEGDEDAGPEAVEMERQVVEPMAIATDSPMRTELAQRQTARHRPQTQVKAVVLIAEPTPQADAGLRTGPSFAGNRPPSYPATARRNGWEGQVMLKLFISATGSLTRVEVARSSGHPLLDAEAVATVRTWQGTPATLNGQPVATTELLPVRFRLK